MSGLKQRLQIAARAAVGIFSDDSMKQAYGLLSGVLPGGMGIPPTRGTAEYLRAYSQMPWLRAVTGRISTAVARTEWQLFVVKGKQDDKAKRDIAIQRASKDYRRALMRKAVDKEELKQIVEHPMLDVLHNANEFQTGYAMRKVTQLHIDLVGDAFWLKERDGQGTVIGLWPIPPNWVLATPTPAFRFFRVQFRAWRGNIPDTEFVWFSDPDPLNPYARGSGAAMALGDELETDEYAARHTKAFFYNQARPDLLVWPKGQGMTQANVNRLEEDWTSKVQGFWRAFKPYFLTREVEVKTLDQNFRSLQLIQLREFERNLVLQHFGVPPEILGVLEHSNRSTIDTADFLMARYVLEPRLEFLRMVLQERFVPEFDERLIVDYVSPAVEDRAQQLAAATVAPWALSMDEWRHMSGMPPMEDEDAGLLHMVPSISKPTTVEDMVTPPPPPAPLVMPGQPRPGLPKPGGNQGPLATEPGEGRRAMSLSGGLVTALEAWSASISEDMTAAIDAGDIVLAETLRKATSVLNADGLPAPTVAASRQEPALAKALVRLWRDHAARLSLHALEGALGPQHVAGDVESLLDIPILNAAQSSLLVQTLTRALLRGADLGAASLRRAGIVVRAAETEAKQGVSVDLAGINPAVTEWAQAHAGALVQAPAAVRANISQLVARANQEGIAPPELARLIRDTIGLTDRQILAVLNFRATLLAAGVEATAREARTLRYAQAQRTARATTIARTELIGALNGGQQMLWDTAVSQGAIQTAQFDKVWIVTDDELLEQQCEAMADEQVPIDEAFSSGDMYPPAHPRCRCAVGLVPAKQKGATTSQAPVVIHNHIYPGSRQVIERDEHGRAVALRVDA